MIMKEYVGIKKISAEPMTRGAYAVRCGRNSILTEKGESTEDAGYLVRYEDGYESWSPKEVFDKAYFEIGTNELIDTCLLMASSDYKDRFKAELIQLEVRLKKLEAMLESWDKGSLGFTPNCPKDTLEIQVSRMSKYLSILKDRAKIEEINLSEERK